MTSPKCLGICLFYNDEDIVSEAITHLLENNHDVIVWDHGSSDNTRLEIERFDKHLLAKNFLPRSFDFYKLFEHISLEVINNWASKYDWISFPESDEFLEGPDRSKSYYEHVCDVFHSDYDWLQFNNVIFWFTEKDNRFEPKVRQRIRYYSVWHDCPPRVYAWRANCMNVRLFNHNPANGRRYPTFFNTCHYQFRSLAQLEKRISGRKNLRKAGSNHHFDFMDIMRKNLIIDSLELNYDSGGDLDLKQVKDWSEVYGTYDKLKEILKSNNK
jgi:hypothetical protein